MEYILSSVFGQALQRTSIVGAVLVVVLLGMVILAFTFFKSKLESSRAETERAAQEHDREVASREAAQASLQAELRENRQQMLDHMRRDEREKNRLSRILGSMVAEIRAMTKVADSLKASIDAHCAQCRDRHDALKEEVLKMRRD